MNHDPLCPMLDESAYPICICGVIAKVRADERKQIVAEYVPVLMQHMQERLDLRARVEALPLLSLYQSPAVNLQTVLDLIDGGES